MLLLASDKLLLKEVQGYVAKDGRVNTKAMPDELLVKVRSRLQELPKGLLAEGDSFEAVLDSGASSFATFDETDMIKGTLKYYDTDERMTGIAGGLQIQGEGVARYELLDPNGRVLPIERKTYLVKELPVRLMPPQCIFPRGSKGQCSIGDGRYTLQFSNGQVVDSELSPVANLPMLRCFRDVKATAKATAEGLYSCVTEEVNQNLRPMQKKLLRWHFRLGHLAMPVIQWMGRCGLLGPACKTMDNSEIPMCGTCNYAKQARKPSGVTRTEVRSEKEGGLKQDMLEPGQGTAVDQFEVVKRGRLLSSFGKEKESEKYVGGTIFVDLASGRMKVYCQHSLNAVETIKSKNKYEREARQCGVMVQSYHADNGVFTAAQYQSELEKNDQTLRLAGVGAHHMNGVAERAIRTMVTQARVMLLHAMLRWPDTTTPDLWPMAMLHAEYLSNIQPREENGLSPNEVFTKTISTHEDLLQLPVWGCPAYVLEPTLQDGKKLPKWKPRS